MRRLVLLLALLAGAVAAQEPPPAVGARGVTLSFPTFLDGIPLAYPPEVVDGLVRAQSIDYLRAELARKLPRPQDFKVCVIEGAPGPGTVPAVRLGGRVVEAAAKLQVRLDAGPYTDAVVVPTIAGYPKTWTWAVPEAAQDGKQRRVYARALRATGTVIALCDNASTSVPWLLQIPYPVPLPPAPPVPPPAPSIALVGNELVGSNMPPGAVSALLQVNGSTGLPGNPAPITSGTWRWRIAYVTPGSTAGYRVRVVDAAGKDLWVQEGSFVAPAAAP